MKNLLAVLTLLISTSTFAQQYSYKVFVLPPFNKVIINNATACARDCFTDKLEAKSSINITGFKNHVCNFTINQNGSLTKDEATSYFCDANTIAATTSQYGQIHLPSHF